MKFFDRTKEIKLLRNIESQSCENAQLTVITGRRRIGKTTTVFEAYNDFKFLYFFVGRKTEKDLCRGFAYEIEDKLNIPMMGEPESFAKIFEFVLKFATNSHVTLFIDEFQDFSKVNPSIFSDIQFLWDHYKRSAKINLIVSGSINSLMHKLFFDKNEPLYQRMDHLIKLRPFTPSVLKNIMDYYCPGYDNLDLLALYAFTGGVPKYVELLIDGKSFTRQSMLERIIAEGSPFIGEGQLILLSEFGKDYGRYFSILSAIASGYTQRSRIENIIGEEVSGYLTRLENDYEIISKKQPLLEQSSTKNVRYEIRDNFMMFWFRFIYKYNYLLEINNYKYLREIASDGYDVFSGLMLERYFREVLAEKEAYSRIGNWWNRKGENEIDIIAIDDFHRKIEFYEVKRNAKKISLKELEFKASHFLAINPSLAPYQKIYLGLSPEDM